MVLNGSWYVVVGKINLWIKTKKSVTFETSGKEMLRIQKRI